jgi:hypothetical protein
MGNASKRYRSTTLRPFGHQCGKPAMWIGTNAKGFACMAEADRSINFDIFMAVRGREPAPANPVATTANDRPSVHKNSTLRCQYEQRDVFKTRIVFSHLCLTDAARGAINPAEAPIVMFFKFGYEVVRRTRSSIAPPMTFHLMSCASGCDSWRPG